MIIGHQKQWNFLKERFLNEQHSHAYLFSGLESLGKKKLAQEFIKLMNCDNRTGQDGCQNCKLLEQEKHQDLLVVKLKEDKSEIEISQIREIQQFLSLKPYCAPFKAVIVDGAEKMNQEAQSCFLKTLEEPKGKTILILISSMPQMLLQTISSRCQEIKFFPTGKDDIKKHLLGMGAKDQQAGLLAEISEGRPGRAIDLMEHPEKLEKEKKIMSEISKVCGMDLASKFQYVKKLEENSQSRVIGSLTKCLRRLLMTKLGINDFPETDYYPAFPEKIKSYPALKIKQLIDLAEAMDFRLLTTNANPKLALEVLLMEI